MVTDAQVRLLRKKMAEGKTIVTAAAAAGMSERSAYAWKQGSPPSETKEARGRRTQPDPFASVWDAAEVPLLEADTGSALEATTVMDELRRQCTGHLFSGSLYGKRKHQRSGKSAGDCHRHEYRRAPGAFLCRNRQRQKLPGAHLGAERERLDDVDRQDTDLRSADDSLTVVRRPAAFMPPSPEPDRSHESRILHHRAGDPHAILCCPQ
jgi:hypothetical protein